MVLWLNWLEHSTVNRKVGGSSPPRTAFKKLLIAQLVERATVAGLYDIAWSLVRFQVRRFASLAQQVEQQTFNL